MMSTEEGENKSVLRNFARKLRKGVEHEDASLISSVLETGDKAKSEIIRLVAKEVRGYLEALELHKDLKHILTNYSLEIKASINLKELVPEESVTEKKAFVPKNETSSKEEDKKS